MPPGASQSGRLKFAWGPSWDRFGALLGRLWRLLGRFGTLLGCLGAILRAQGPSEVRESEKAKIFQKRQENIEFGLSGPSWGSSCASLGAC